MYTTMNSSVSSTLVTVCAFRRSCFLINVSMSTSVGSFRVPWSETTKVPRCGVLFKPLSTRNPKHSQDLACHYTFWTRAAKSDDSFIDIPVCNPHKQHRPHRYDDQDRPRKFRVLHCGLRSAYDDVAKKPS